MSKYELGDLKDYNIDDLFYSVNDIYTLWDDGDIHYNDAQELLFRCCKAFIRFNKGDVKHED